jgi:intraflagellar transport protein 74
MNYEIDTHSNDSKLHSQLDRKHEILVRDVKELQGQLADYNIVLDKVGTETPPEEINAQYLQLKQRNDVERKKVDAVFTERSTWEQRTKDVDHQIVNYQRGTCTCRSERFQYLRPLNLVNRSP